MLGVEGRDWSRGRGTLGSWSLDSRHSTVLLAVETHSDSPPAVAVNGVVLDPCCVCIISARHTKESHRDDPVYLTYTHSKRSDTESEQT